MSWWRKESVSTRSTWAMVVTCMINNEDMREKYVFFLHARTLAYVYCRVDGCQTSMIPYSEIRRTEAEQSVRMQTTVLNVLLLCYMKTQNSESFIDRVTFIWRSKFITLSARKTSSTFFPSTQSGLHFRRIDIVVTIIIVWSSRFNKFIFIFT